MSYIRMEHRVLSSDRVLDLSPAALVTHVYGLDWCNEQATDGRIPIRRAHRLMCQLDPMQLIDGWTELVAAGIWVSTDDGYVCHEFLSYGLEGNEQHQTRAKWAEDKRRQRLHRVGNHDLCTMKSCPAKRAASGTESTPQVEQDPLISGRPDQTRPDQTHKGSGSACVHGNNAATDPQGRPICLECEQGWKPPAPTPDMEGCDDALTLDDLTNAAASTERAAT
jgi:hypothetical protein